MALTLRAGIGLVAMLVVVGTAMASSRHSDEVSAVAIEVPVQVLRDGQPVRGLTRDDFRLYDGRKRVALTGFDVVDAGNTTATVISTSPSARRHFLLLFDLAFSDLRAVVAARHAASAMVAELHPSDLVGVATYSDLHGPRLVLGFTSDRAQIDTAIRTLGAPELLDLTPDPLRLVLGHERAPSTISADQGGGLGETQPTTRKGLGMAMGEGVYLDALESMVAKAAEASEEVQRQQVESFTGALSEFAHLLGAVDGRKYVVYLSQGFDAALLRGTSDERERQDNRDYIEHGDLTKVRSSSLFGDTRSINASERMLEELRRADCVVESVDIGRLAAAADQGLSRRSSTETLLDLAKSTGGELFENYNDLGDAMRQMLSRTSVTYVLAFQPENLIWDGSYHRLRVELVKQPGTRLVYRPGYFAPVPYQQRSPAERMLEAQSAIAGGAPGGTIGLDVLATALPMSGGSRSAYVTLIVEMDGPSFLASGATEFVGAEIYAYAIDAAGEVADHLDQKLRMELQMVPNLASKGLRYFGHLELPPGDFAIRVMVRNAATGERGLRVTQVHVPDFSHGAPALLAAFVPPAGAPWLTIQEAPRADHAPTPRPFAAGGAPFVPAALPELTSGPARLVLVTYGAPSGELTWTARVLDGAGNALEAVPVTVSARDGDGRRDLFQADVTLPALRAGSYRLDVRAASGTFAATSTTPFVVRAAAGLSRAG